MKLSAPLKSGLRTSEGVLVYASNILLAVAAVLPHGLSWQKSGLYLAILNASYAVSRSGVKAFAAINAPLGVTGDPTLPAGLPSQAEVDAEIATVEQAVSAFQAQPGTPADQIVAGLSPVVTPEPPVAT